MTNSGTEPRQISVYTFCEFASVGHVYNDLVNLQYSMFVNKADWVDGMLALASHPYEPFDPKDLAGVGRQFMAVTGQKVVAIETLRDNFLGFYGSYAAPDALAKNEMSENEESAGIAFNRDAPLHRRIIA